MKFDQLVEQLLEENRCTKVTGQQSSTRSDKKYMRCAKVDGKLKRVHYGDPNLRIKKSNPKDSVFRHAFIQNITESRYCRINYKDLFLQKK